MVLREQAMWVCGLVLIGLVAVTGAGTTQKGFLPSHDCDVCEAVMMQVELSLDDFERRPRQHRSEADLIDMLERTCSPTFPGWQRYGVTHVQGIPLFTGPGLDGYDATASPPEPSDTWNKLLAQRCAEIVGEVGEVVLLEKHRAHWRLAVAACNVDVEASYCGRDWLLHEPKVMGGRPQLAAATRRLQDLRKAWAKEPPTAEQAAANAREEAQQQDWTLEAMAETRERLAKSADAAKPHGQQLPPELIDALKRRHNEKMAREEL